MNANNVTASAADSSQVPLDLRVRLAEFLEQHSDRMVSEGAVAFVVADALNFDGRTHREIPAMLVTLLAAAIRNDRMEAHGGAVSAIQRTLSTHGIRPDRVFALMSVLERIGLDELALDDRVGVSTDEWPLAAQLLRRASFDVLAGFAAAPPADSFSMLVDPLTTLVVRAVFEMAVRKELDRATRSAAPVSVLLFDIDDMSEINRSAGLGVGDKILERVGVLVSGFFRQYDWIARYAADAIAVLLVDGDEGSAMTLAEGMRGAVADRLTFQDPHSGQTIKVTVSVGVATTRAGKGQALDPDRVLAAAESALKGSQAQGGNRVTHATVESPYPSRSS